MAERRAGRPKKLMTVEEINRLHELLKKMSIAEVAREMGVSRPTIYRVLKEHPKPIKRIRKPEVREAVDVEKFEQLEAVKEFEKWLLDKRKRTGRPSLEKIRSYIRIGARAWIILKKKHPYNWDEEDYSFLWGHPEMKSSITGLMGYEKAVALRQWMMFTDRRDLLDKFPTTGLKPEPRKKLEYLKSVDEIIAVCNAIKYPDTLVMFRLGIECGARFSSLSRIRPKDIDRTMNLIMMYEPKVKKTVERYFNTDTIDFVLRYISDFKFKPNESIFPRELDAINADLKQAGKLARIPFDLTTHVAMKHTFVSLASNYGVDLAIVSEQTGTDPKTLRQFYLGIDVGRIRHQLLGEEYPVPTFHEFVKKIHPYFMRRYDEIRLNLARVDGLAKDRRRPRREPKIKEIKKRRISYEAIQKLLSSGAPETLKAYWRERIAREGVKKFYEVKG